jgi:molecular chaperone DnaK (HSP70)
MTKTKKIYGIDLGTTTTAIAFVDEYGKPQIIPNSKNERITASVVYYEDATETIVGETAKESAKMAPERAVAFVKREVPNKDWVFTIDGHSYRPEEISAHILRSVVNDVNKSGEHDVKDVVITCPAFFGDFERERTKTAGELAGLNVRAIIDEPVAAAIYYGLKDNVKGMNILVYDLGGGTFDATVVQVDKKDNSNDIRVICTDGNHQLGGKNWDDSIIKYYLDEFASQTGSNADLLSDPDTAYELQLGAEKDKKTLSEPNKKSVMRKISFDGEKAIIELTGEKFDELTKNWLDLTFKVTDYVLELAKTKGVMKVDTIILVGGSTRMKQVKAGVTKRYGIEPIDLGNDVDLAVAKGAAKVGEIELIKEQLREKEEEIAKGKGKNFYSLPSKEQEEIKQEAKEEVAAEAGYTSEKVAEATNTNIQVVATKSYGLKILNAKKELIVVNLIVKQTVVPVKNSDIFQTVGHNVTEVSLEVFLNNESEAETTPDVCEKLGEAKFLLDGNLPAGSPIEVIFELDEQGNLRVTGIDQTFGKMVNAKFQSDGVMSIEEKEDAKARLTMRKYN